MATRTKLATCLAIAGIVVIGAPGPSWAGAVDEYRIIAPDSRDFKSPADRTEVLEPEARRPGGSPTGTSIWQMTPEQLEGMPVVTGESRRIGEVEQIVRNRQTGEIGAVVDIGGFLGIGAKQAVLPLSAMELQRGTRLVYATERSKELPRTHTYDSAHYTDVKEKTRLAAMRGQPEQTSFAALDRDGNGYISREEAAAAAGLLHYWGRVDTNGDGRLDRAEFSAYETPGEHSRATGPQGHARESGQ